MTSDAGAGRLLGVCAAARALGLNPSTISRYLRRHPELNHGTATRPKVDEDELRRHRIDNTNPAHRNSHAGLLLDANGPASGPASGNGHDAAPPAYAAAKAEREAALAERARLDLDEKLSGLLVRAEVLEAFEATLQVMQRQLSELAPRLAEKLAIVDTVKEAQALMEREYRALLKKCAVELAGW